MAVRKELRPEDIREAVPRETTAPVARSPARVMVSGQGDEPRVTVTAAPANPTGSRSQKKIYPTDVARRRPKATSRP